MKHKFKHLATTTLAGLFLASAGVGVAIAVGGASSNGTQNEKSVQSLWEESAGFSVSKNVDVPDYMKYGSFVNYSDTTKLYTVDENSQEDYLEDWEKNGMKLTSTIPGKKIYYSNIVDISSFTTKDDLLVFSPLTSNRGAPDFTEIEFVLEDVENEDNYLKITVKENSWYTPNIMIAVSTPNVSARGYRWGDGGEISPNGCADIVSVSFRGNTVEPGKHNPQGGYRHRAVQLHYDVTEKLVSVTGQGGKTYPVLDLDDGHSVGYGNAWQGFTNNRVRLSVGLNSFSASEASLLMLKAFGQGLNGEEILDSVAPTFSFDEIAHQTPSAEMGKVYPIYSCVSDDVVSGQVIPEVFLKAPNGNEEELTGDSFVPQQQGYYTLTYRAKDEAGNIAEKKFDVLSQNASPKIEIEVEQEKNVFKLGEKIPVAEPSLSGGAGALEYTVRAYRVGGEETAISEASFIPYLKGEYHLVYEAKDYLGNIETESLSYIVEESPSPVWESSMQKLVRLFDSVTVKLPKPEVYDYTTFLGNRVNAEYTITAKNAVSGYEEKIENGIFTPTKEKFGERVTFVYKTFYKDKEAQAEEFSYNVALEESPKRLDGYFKYNESDFSAVFNAKDEADCLRFVTPSNAQGSKEFSFVNPVMAEGFELAFAVPATATNFETLTIRLEDSENKDIGFDLQLRDMLTGRDKDLMTYVQVNGVDYAMNGTYNTLKDGVEIGSKTPMYLQYADGKIIDYNKSCVCVPSLNFNGEKFEGFPSGKLFISFIFDGVKGAAGITITKLSNQTFYAAYDRVTGEMLPFKDDIRPQIRLEKDIQDEILINQTLEIPYAQAYDAISPYLEVYVSLRKPNGEYVYKDVISTKGMKFVMESYGGYRLSFFAKDGAGKTQTVNYTLEAKDLIVPTIVVLGAEKMEAKVGRNFKIPDAVVQDNKDGTPKLFIMIVKPDYSILVLGERTESAPKFTYKFEQAGEYYIRYYAVDAEYNVTIVDRLVSVK